jgi:hypothetical protein
MVVRGGGVMSKKSDTVAAKHLPLAAKKIYRAPRLIEFGHISRITSGTTGTHSDKGHLGGAHGSG